MAQDRDAGEGDGNERVEGQLLATGEPSLTADSCGLLPIRLTSRLIPLREEFQRALPLPLVKMIPVALGNLNCKITYMSIMGVKAKAFWLSLAKISS